MEGERREHGDGDTDGEVGATVRGGGRRRGGGAELVVVIVVVV